jgi:rhodanese-related sulfurtransferase
MFTQPSPYPFSQITVEELAEKLANATNEIQFIDVREPQELAIAKISGFTNLPLSEFVQWGERIHQDFDKDRETLVLCHHGMRSAQMCQWLATQGFTQVKNIVGGIDAYSSIVDPSVPHY